ncbi:MAG TPA: DNA-3-methyladenine glycosylase 2 family protein [Acidimicrobiia bacterium]
MSPRRPSKRLVEASERLAELDPVMRTMLERIGPCDLRRGRPHGEHFAELARAITYQQLAGRAAAAIHGRFVALFDGKAPTPEAVLALPVDQLRSAGLSGSKTASIRDLAQKVVDGSVQLDRIARLPDDEIERELTLVRGIGPWTAEMFLIFQLGRLDVWPVEDFGVRSGYARLYGLADVPPARELVQFGDRFRPYRSVAAWYCWRAADTVTLEEE